MSESSKSLINLLFELISTSIKNESEPEENEITAIANILDENIQAIALSVVEEKISTVKAEISLKEEKPQTIKLKKEKYKTPEECPVGFCAFILTRGDFVGSCCSNKNSAGKIGCSTHWKKMDGVGATGPAIANTSGTKTAAQNDNTTVEKPPFSLKSGSRNFKNLKAENKEPKEVTTFTKKTEGGQFKHKKLNLTASVTKKAEFFKRVLICKSETEDEEDNETEIYFTNDPIGSKFAFLKENGSFTIVGLMTGDMDVEDNDEDLPSDFADEITENYEDEVDEKVSKWFARNNVVT